MNLGDHRSPRLPVTPLAPTPPLLMASEPTASPGPLLPLPAPHQLEGHGPSLKPTAGVHLATSPLSQLSLHGCTWWGTHRHAVAPLSSDSNLAQALRASRPPDGESPPGPLSSAYTEDTDAPVFSRAPVTPPAPMSPHAAPQAGPPRLQEQLPPQSPHPLTGSALPASTWAVGSPQTPRP